ncbi:hypothetical protein ACQVRV_00380 (plasmid) [Ralstonia pseudosolanacearum]
MKTLVAALLIAPTRFDSIAAAARVIDWWHNVTLLTINAISRA